MNAWINQSQMVSVVGNHYFTICQVRLGTWSNNRVAASLDASCPSLHVRKWMKFPFWTSSQLERIQYKWLVSMFNSTTRKKCQLWRGRQHSGLSTLLLNARIFRWFIGELFNQKLYFLKNQRNICYTENWCDHTVWIYYNILTDLDMDVARYTFAARSWSVLWFF